MSKIVRTYINDKGERLHAIDGEEVSISCTGQDCIHCNYESTRSFLVWESSIPYPRPPKGKRYKRPIARKNMGKSIIEICYSCKKTPCYICVRTKCEYWHKEEERKGQEEGCSRWEQGRCRDFVCKKGIIKTHW